MTIKVYQMKFPCSYFFFNTAINTICSLVGFKMYRLLETVCQMMTCKVIFETLKQSSQFSNLRRSFKTAKLQYFS